MYKLFLEHEEFGIVQTEEEALKVIEDITDGNVPINVTYEMVEWDNIPRNYLWDVMIYKDKAAAYPYPINRNYHNNKLNEELIRNDDVLCARVFAGSAKQAIEKTKEMKK